MIYRKRAYTPPPLRRVSGTTYTLTQTAHDGAVVSVSHVISNAQWDAMREPRIYLAAQLLQMRRTLRMRMALYLQGVVL